jgi:hypothetical protein
MFRQLLLPRFLNSNPCDKLVALRLSRHLLKSRSNVSNSRHQIIAIMAFLSTQLVDRNRNHQLRTSLTGFSSPTSFSFTLSPLNAMLSNLCPKSILIKATNQAYLLKGSSDDNKRCGIFFIDCVQSCSCSTLASPLRSTSTKRPQSMSQQSSRLAKR